METTEAMQRVAGSRSARLATMSGDGRPHVVPIVFALEDDKIYFAVDYKPKRTTNLKRLKNIAENPAVSLLIDHYEEDWTRLWWVRVDGIARVVTDTAEAERATDLLAKRYPQYRTSRPGGPVVAIHIEHLAGWTAT
jgi:PPOX class probable F420-dependent enzyme